VLLALVLVAILVRYANLYWLEVLAVPIMALIGLGVIWGMNLGAWSSPQAVIHGGYRRHARHWRRHALTVRIHSAREPYKCFALEF
jgi:hypothetical protein